MLKKFKENMKSKKGFTLVELIVVIVIVLILGAALIPNVFKYIDRARAASVKADAASAMTEVQAYIADEIAKGNACPTSVASAADTDVSKTTKTNTTSFATAGTGDYSITSFVYTEKDFTATFASGSGWSVSKKGINTPIWSEGTTTTTTPDGN